jgi:hypothetical protein
VSPKHPNHFTPNRLPFRYNQKLVRRVLLINNELN